MQGDNLDTNEKPSSCYGDACETAYVELAEEDGPRAELRWSAFDDNALEEEIVRYRTGVRAVESQLKDLGISYSADQENQGSEDSKYGVEGVDYHYGSVADLDPSEWQVPKQCIPIHSNVTTYDWSKLYSVCQFDVIMMDPPWQLATANPTRGVALGYSQLTDADIENLPIPKLQSNGFLFIWVINAKYKFCLDLFDKWGYKMVDEIVWAKMTVNRRLAKSHGYYLQHAKEVCLVAKKGADPDHAKRSVGSDVIFSERRGQSQKPEEIYELIEELVPRGRYLEIFARKNNLRDFWVSLGNEVTGTGLPEADMEALHSRSAIPGAVYGSGNRSAK
mmetsp:Transcript_16000/g.37934  ORF Transcript_16000/g.37934 Transcript_16000/m.37934 type:complete len:334 (+) Transcript_16000:67-1068(+)